MSDRRPASSGGPFRFVGRGRELDLLLSAVRRPPAVVMLEGEAGIGKSRLIREATAVLAGDGLQVLAGFCHPLREPFPYGPVVDALRKADLDAASGGFPATAGALAPLLPDFADRLPPQPPQPMDAPGQRLRVVQAVRSFLGALGPAVLVVEDLHWVDEETRDLLLLLARDLPSHLRLVLTYRAEDLPPRSAVLGAAYRHPPGTSGTVVRLGPLAAGDIQELAVAALGPDATARFCAALFERSEGLPLVAEEDLITLVEAGEGDGSGSAVARLRKANVPRGLREAVTERLAALSPAAAAVAEAAAVLAVPTEEELLEAVAHVDAEQGAEALIELLEASLLREADEGRYAFRHVLAQQVAYKDIPAPARIRLHRRAIEALRAHPALPLVQIAHHTLATGDRATWLLRAQEAVDQAMSMGDTGTAAKLLHQMLERPELRGEPRSQAALALAQIAAYGVDFTTNVRSLRRLLADPQLPEDIRGEIRLGLGLGLLNQNADPSGFHEVELAADELAARRPERAARAMTALALKEAEGPGYTQAWLERAEETIKDSPDEATKAAVRATRLTLMACSGDPGVWVLAEQLPRGTQDTEVLRQTARALHNVADAATDLGHDRRAAALTTEAQQIGAETGSPITVYFSRLALLRLEGLAGRWDGLAERFDAVLEEYPGAVPLSEHILLRGVLAAARGQHARALEYFTEAAEVGEKQLTISIELRAAAGLASIHLADGDPTRAWTVADRAVTVVRRAEAWPKSVGLVPVAVAAALACDRRRAADQLVAEAEDGIRDRDTPAGAADLELARGLLREDVEPDVAAQHYASAAALWREIGRPYEEARAQERRGRALARMAPEEATQELTRAAATFTRLGATGDVAHCEHILRELGHARPTPGRPGYGGALSPREQQVAELLATGATNQQIAQTLFLSPRTVEHHVASVLKKLGTTRKDVPAVLRDSARTGTTGGD